MKRTKVQFRLGRTERVGLLTETFHKDQFIYRVLGVIPMVWSSEMHSFALIDMYILYVHMQLGT